MGSREPLGHIQRLEVQARGIIGHRILRWEGGIFLRLTQGVSSQVDLKTGSAWRGQATVFHPW